MISVASHLRQLNGNNVMSKLYFISIVLLFLSCATRKTVFVPSNNNNPLPKKHSDSTPVKIDTVAWSFPEKKVPTPKSKYNKQTEVVPEVKTKSKSKFSKEADIFRIITLIPFKTETKDSSSVRINLSSIRYVHFYAGMRMAIEELSKEIGKKIIVNVFDCESVTDATEILAKFNQVPPHLIIGPQNVEALKYTANWAKEHETSIISPWVSSSSITDNNPYYIQTKAGLAAHYNNINQHARNHYPVDNIILISKSEEESKSKNFNDSLKYKDISEKVVKEADLANGVDPVIYPLLKDEGPTVFILPFSSSKDENYIYHFIRRAMSEKINKETKENKEVIIYGMYKWLEMKSDIIDFLNLYNIRLSISNYFDQDNLNIKDFKRRYFEHYREFPSQDVLEGYDVMKYSIVNLRRTGMDFQMSESMIDAMYLETNFEVHPIRKAKFSDSSNPIDYYENEYIKMVELRNNRYKIVE